MDKELLLKDMQQANGSASLVRKAYNEETWEEFEKCAFAFFPGCQLGASEPEITIKTYDSIRFRNPDTGAFFYCCGIPAKMAGNDTLLDETLADIKSKWESLGKPTMIMACMGCYKLFAERLPEIPMISLYKFLHDMDISGGCNSVDYCIKDPVTITDGDDTPAIVRALAEDMGVKLHEESEASDYPYLVYSIKERDALKRSGKDAVHILELIYGMGASNSHMEHEHEHEHEDEHGHEDEHQHHGERAQECRTGDCNSCTGSCDGSCEDSCTALSSALPDDEQRQRNRMQLKQAMPEFFWNEDCHE